MSNWEGGSTRAWRKLRLFVLARDNHTCRLNLDGCTELATAVHHVDGVKAGKICPPDRLLSSCVNCNNAVGDPTQDDFPHTQGSGHPTDRVRSLSLQPNAADLGQVVPRPDLIWSRETIEPYPWLQPFLEVPPDAAVPLAMTPVPEDAVGSYGEQAIEWIEAVERKTLRWWQRLAITRQLEHRADGSLCFRMIVESAPRRAGKSVRVRGVALWRMAHPEVFNSPEPQTVVHTGSDVAICREIQRGAWRWAEEDAGWTVSRSNGKEAVETPAGDRWLVRAQQAVYGYNVDLGVADECWNVKADTISEGLEPATLERSSPQIHLTSTAHRRATSLMKSQLLAALTMETEGTLLLLWSAPAGADPGDEATWKAASPHWSEDRRRLIADKYAKALAGEADPQADDPDPMQGFIAQYLNRWQLTEVKKDRGEAVVSPDEWAVLADDRPDGEPYAAAIEDWFGDGVSLAVAWKVDDRVVVAVEDHLDLGSAAASLKASGFRRTAVIGTSLLEDPALRGIRARKGQGRPGAAVQELQRLMSEDAFRHDGSEHLTGQVLAARTMPGADGPKLVSQGRADALKTAVWAVSECRRKTARPLLIAPRDSVA
jgi:hypothetical protein